MRHSDRAPHASGHSRHPGPKRTSLSLDAFSKAKRSTYDPRLAKEKERLRATRTVVKYKKLVRARLQVDNNRALDTSSEGADREQERKPKMNQRDRDNDTKQGIQESQPERGPSKTDREPTAAVQLHDKEVAANDIEARTTKIKERREQHKLHQKKTRHGQPLMKYRIQNLLGTIERELK
jgi:hypothetical protein